MIILLFVTMSSLQLEHSTHSHYFFFYVFLSSFGKIDFFVDYKFNVFSGYFFIPSVDAEKKASLKHDSNSEFSKSKQFVQFTIYNRITGLKYHLKEQWQSVCMYVWFSSPTLPNSVAPRQLTFPRYLQITIQPTVYSFLILRKKSEFVIEII